MCISYRMNIGAVGTDFGHFPFVKGGLGKRGGGGGGGRCSGFHALHSSIIFLRTGLIFWGLREGV